MMSESTAKGAGGDDAIPSPWQDGRGKVNCPVAKQDQVAFRHFRSCAVEVSSVALRSCGVDRCSRAWPLLAPVAILIRIVHGDVLLGCCTVPTWLSPS